MLNSTIHLIEDRVERGFVASRAHLLVMMTFPPDFGARTVPEASVVSRAPNDTEAGNEYLNSPFDADRSLNRDIAYHSAAYEHVLHTVPQAPPLFE